MAARKSPTRNENHLLSINALCENMLSVCVCVVLTAVNHVSLRFHHKHLLNVYATYIHNHGRIIIIAICVSGLFFRPLLGILLWFE